MSPEKRPFGPASIDAAAADAKPLPTPQDRFRWTNTPGTRRLRVQFDGGWLSLRSRNRTSRPGTSDSDAQGVESRQPSRLESDNFRWQIVEFT